MPNWRAAGQNLAQYTANLGTKSVEDAMALSQAKKQMAQLYPIKYKLELENAIKLAEAKKSLDPYGDSTNDIQEYQFARTQGYPGTFNDWDLSRKKAGATNLSFLDPENQAMINKIIKESLNPPPPSQTQGPNIPLTQPTLKINYR